MMIQRMSGMLGVLILAAGWESVAMGQAEAPADANDRQQALAWLNNDPSLPVLLTAEQLQAVRDKLTKATPKEAQEWWQGRQQIVSALNDASYQSTVQWFDQFLQVQAIYTKAQVARMHQDFADALENTPVHFIDLLNKLAAMRGGLTQGAAQSAALRKETLAMNQQNRQEISNQQAAARQLATSLRPRIPTSGEQPVKTKQYSAINPPLVTSMQVAQWAVWRAIWGRW